MSNSAAVSAEERFKEFTCGVTDFMISGILDICGKCVLSFPPFDSSNPQNLHPVDEHFMKFFSGVLVKHYSSKLSFRGWPITKFRPYSSMNNSHDVFVYEARAFRLEDREEVSLLVFVRKKNNSSDLHRVVVGWTGPVTSVEHSHRLNLDTYLEAGLIYYCSPEEENTL